MAYWKLDEASGTRYDSSGNNNNLLDPTNTVTSTSGVVKNAAVFNSANYLQANSLLNTSNDFSVSFWLHNLSSAYAGAHIIGSPSDSGWFAQWLGRGYQIGLAFATNGMILDNTPEDYTNFRHYVFTKTGNTITLYRNGGLVATNIITGYTFPIGARVFYIGSNGGTYGFIGIFDEVGIWNRVLSQTEAAELYSLGKMQISYPFQGDEVPSICLDPNATNCQCNNGYFWDGLQCVPILSPSPAPSPTPTPY